jgi:hypothetical protein
MSKPPAVSGMIGKDVDGCAASFNKALQTRDICLDY